MRALFLVGTILNSSTLVSEIRSNCNIYLTKCLPKEGTRGGVVRYRIVHIWIVDFGNQRSGLPNNLCVISTVQLFNNLNRWLPRLIVQICTTRCCAPCTPNRPIPFLPSILFCPSPTSPTTQTLSWAPFFLVFWVQINGSFVLDLEFVEPFVFGKKGVWIDLLHFFYLRNEVEIPCIFSSNMNSSTNSRFGHGL